MKKILLLAFFVLVSSCSKPKSSEIKTVVLTNNDRFDSLDPLNADKWQNMAVMRLMYLQPIEISAKDEFRSKALESFNYEPKTKTMTWIVRSGNTFQNGEVIVTKDILYSVLRMINRTPNFPIVREIIGVKEWMDLPTPKRLQLPPQGIKVSENKIDITFNIDVGNPFFRFSLELFSIIPSSCINEINFELICKHPSESGYYRLEEGDVLKFIKRDDQLIHGFNAVPAFYLKNILAKEISKDIDLTDTVLVGRSDLFNENFLQELAEKDVHKIHRLPAVNMLMFLLNPNLAPFDRVEVRQHFARLVRKNLVQTKVMAFDFSKSFLTKLIPGYLDDSEFEEAREFDLKKLDLPDSIEFFYAAKTIAPDFREAVVLSLKELGFKDVKVTVVESKNIAFNLFAENKSFFAPVYTGFWDKDPLNDVQMLFTQNLHPVFKHMASIPELRALLDLELRDAGSDKKRAEVLKKINRYLYQDAKLNMVGHVRGFYLTRENNYNARSYTLLRDAVGPLWLVLNEHRE
jgi:ABC-type transport system substrate-binding protein